MAEKREHSTHVRMCDASDAMLSFLAESKGEDKAKIVDHQGDKDFARYELECAK